MKHQLTLATLLAAFSSFAAAEYRDLPTEYTQVEFIRSTKSQYIDTGVYAGPDVSAVLDFTPHEYTGDVNIGTQPGDDNRDWRFFNYSGGSMFDVGNQRIGFNNDTKLTLDTRYVVEMGNAYLNIYNADGTLKWSATGNKMGSGNIIASKIFVCANNTGNASANHTAMTVYSLTMSDSVDGSVQLVRDFVPCVRNADNEPGLYDLVNDEFYPDAAHSGTKFTVGPEVECPDPVASTLKISSFSDITPSEASVHVSVERVSWTGNATLTLLYGNSTNTMLHSITVAAPAAAGAYTAQLLGLRPGSTWYVSAVITPATGDPIVTLPKSFDTLADVGGIALPGLLQGYVSNSGWNTTFVITNQANLGRTIGAVAAHTSTDASWPVYLADGSETTARWGDNTTFGYVGLMYLTGQMLTVGAKMDDNVRLTIDGTQVIDQSGNALKLATYQPTHGAGWYPIEIRVGNGSGGYGPYGGFKGLCWNTDSYTTDDTSSNWHEFLDPGDGSLLRPGHCAEIPVVETGWVFANDELTARVTCCATPQGGELRLYAAAENGLDDTNAWTLVRAYSLPSETDSQFVSVVGVGIPSSANVARFFLWDAESDTSAWSKTLSLVLVQDPQVDAYAPNPLSGTSATLSGKLANLGVPGDTIVSTALDPAPETGDGVFSVTLSAISDLAFPVVDLVPGTTYTYAFHAVNAGGFASDSDTITFTTPAGSTVKGHSVSTDGLTATIAASLNVGAGTTTATVRFGAEGQPLENYPASFDAYGNLSLTIPGLAWGTRYTYGIHLENTETSANGTVYTWTDDTGDQTNAVAIYDTSTYVWKGAANGGVDEGDWRDAANWSTSAEDASERPGYPTDNSTVIFNGPGPYVVTLDRSYTLYRLQLSGSADVTLRAVAEDISLAVENRNVPAGSKLRVSHLSLTIPDTVGNTETYVTDGGRLDWTSQFPSYNGALISLSGGSYFHGTHENYPGAGGFTFIADDSEINIDRWFYHSETAENTSTILVKGRSPYVYGGMFQPRGAYPGNITFSIPVGGYNITEEHPSPVYGWGSFMSENLWGTYYYTGVNIELDPHSPAITQGGGSLDQLLITTGYFGLSEEADANGQRHPLLFFDNSTLPEGCYFYFTDATGTVLTDAAGDVIEGENIQTARQLWCHIQSQGSTVILLQ